MASAKLTGLTELLFALTELPKRIGDRIERKALRKASRAIVVTARSNLAPHNDDRLLSKSLGVKIKRNRRTSKITAIIGPRKGMAGTDKRTGKPADPVRYAHLVEKGHAGPAPAPAYPWLIPAFNSVNSGKIIADEIETGIQIESAKLAFKGAIK